MTYQTITENNRTYYLCDCGIKGSDESVIAQGYCHRRNNERHRDDIPATIVKKKELKYKFKGTSVRKFNKYFEKVIDLNKYF